MDASFLSYCIHSSTAHAGLRSVSAAGRLLLEQGHNDVVKRPHGGDHVDVAGVHDVAGEAEGPQAVRILFGVLDLRSGSLADTLENLSDDDCKPACAAA